MWNHVLKEIITNQHVLDNISVVDKEVFINGMRNFGKNCENESLGEAFAWFYPLNEPIDKFNIIPFILRYFNVASDREEINIKANELENEVQCPELNYKLDHLNITEQN
jgi:hypothetical protein